MEKKHTLSKKLPIVSMLLACGVAMAATVVVPDDKSVMSYLLSSAVALAVLLVFWWWFSPEFKGDFKPRASLKEVAVLLIPFIAFCVLAAVFSWLDGGVYFKPTAMAVAMGIAAGFVEETWFRGLAVPIGMGYLPRDRRILVTVLVTSIFFGVLHLGNIFGGAQVVIGVIQAIATTFGGIFFIAVFLRTGSILVPIIMHGFYDWVCFVTDPSLAGGVMMNEGVTLGLGLALALHIVLGCIGIYLVRPAMHGRINEIWDQIWT